MIDFLRSIGLGVITGAIRHETFMPGVSIERGKLIVDFDNLTFPGDLLHEAGHLAVMSPARRRNAHSTAGKRAAEEMMAIAWSYAAAVHLAIEPAVVFHEGGYRGGSRALIENFAEGRYIGVPTLQWLGMTADKRRADELGVAPYPAMLQWLNSREDE